MEEITGLVVTYNTKDLIEKAFTSVRKFHPTMPILIMDGSKEDNPCYDYTESLQSKITRVVHLGSNLGHGRAMHMGLQMIQTKYCLLFDSDIIMHKSPIEGMLKLMKEDTYAVGYKEEVGPDGYEYKVKDRVLPMPPVKYIHPYFMLLQVKEYFKFAPFIHHGAPCYKAMNDINSKGLSEKILIEFPGLGHSSGKGWGWVGEPREFIEHHAAGTRHDRSSKGEPEIDPGWEFENWPFPKVV
jgi:glycosyltransferase involved in cell wall biosynthesis